MTKNNKILLGILAFIVSITVGYAVFTQTVTVSGTATANGTFQITTSCVTGWSSNYLISSGEANTLEKRNEDQQYYKNDVCNVSGNKVTMTTELTQPGASRMFTIEFKNTGTISAVIEVFNSIYTVNQTVKLYNRANGTLFDTLNITEGMHHNEKINKDYGYFAPAGLFIYDENIEYLDDDECFLEDNTDRYPYVKLDPGHTLGVIFGALWEEDAEQTDY